MIKEETYYVVDSLGVSQPETIERASVTLPQLFVEGGLVWMIGISLLLIALFIAAWKAPRWVKEIGIAALVFAVFGTLLGILQVLDVLHLFGDISPAVVCGGLKVTLIPTFYGLIVYFISLVIRVIQKPRI
ncbi:MAG: MotA/TolQ/ExbB proton channel family protein [Bacteroidales bacterium]|nr:MotA/TolQ/ExbB proton channel family protein [Bacteroidales bacterium]